MYPPPGQIVRGDRGVVHVDCHPVLVRAASVLRLALLYHGSPGTRLPQLQLYICSENCCGLMEELICPFIANNFTQGGGSGDMSSGKRCKTANCLQLFNVRTSAGSRYKYCEYPPLLLLAGYFREYSTFIVISQRGNILVPGFRLIVAGEGHFHNTLAARQIEINISGPPTTAGHHLHCSSELETRSLNKLAEI